MCAAFGQTGFLEENYYQNDPTTGTVEHELVAIDAPHQVVVATGSAVVIGICHDGCGRSGKATVSVSGIDQCTFDNATTSGDYVTNNGSGACHDAGATSPSSQVVGIVLSTNASSGTYDIQFSIGGGGGGGKRNLGGGPAAKCQGGVAGAAYSFTSPAPTATCESDSIQGYLDFTESTAQSVNDVLQLPADWAGTATAVLTAYSTSTSAPTIGVALVCDSTGASASPSYGSSQTISLTPLSASGRTRVSTSLTTTGCAAGYALYWKLTITAASAADLHLLSFQITE